MKNEGKLPMMRHGASVMTKFDNHSSVFVFRCSYGKCVFGNYKCKDDDPFASLRHSAAVHLLCGTLRKGKRREQVTNPRSRRLEVESRSELLNDLALHRRLDRGQVRRGQVPQDLTQPTTGDNRQN